MYATKKILVVLRQAKSHNILYIQNFTIDESHYCHRMSKVWWSAFGDKWYIFDDGDHTLEVDINFAEKRWNLYSIVLFNIVNSLTAQNGNKALLKVSRGDIARSFGDWKEPNEWMYTGTTEDRATNTVDVCTVSCHHG